MSAILQTPPPLAEAKLLTAEEFFAQYENKYYELVDGRAVEVAMPGAKHGKACTRSNQFLANYCDQHQVGRVMSNDTFIVTKRDPDAVRGADVLFVSYAKLPKDSVPEGPLEVAPELVFEVRSPSDSWTDAIEKMLEYLRAGVRVVVILDPQTESASVFRPGLLQDTFAKDQSLVIPDVLPGFSVLVGKFFE